MKESTDLQDVKMANHSITPYPESSNRHDVPTEHAKTVTSSSLSSTAKKEDNFPSPDICSGRSISEWGEEKDEQLVKQEGTDGSEPGKTEQSSSSVAMKEGEASRISGAEEGVVGESSGRAGGWDRYEADAWPSYHNYW